MDYWSDQNHRKWESHYFQCGNTNFLAFTKDWADSLKEDSLLCNLLDTENNKIYKMPIYLALEKRSEIYVDYETIEHFCLMPYFYNQHHCPCHRHTDAVNAGLNESTDNFECAGNRFLIESIVFKDLILCSETIPYDELEQRLNDRSSSYNKI